MKTCEQYAELVPALAEDVLPAGEADEVRSHIDGCSACGESWKLQELISRHLRETDLAADKPDYYWAKQRKHILDQVGFSTSRVLMVDRPRRPFLKIAIAAAAALLVAVGVVALLRNPETAPPNTIRKKTWMDDRPVVQDAPKEDPQTPEAPSKPELGVQPPQYSDAPPEPPPADRKAPEPEKKPKEDIVKEDPAPPAKGPAPSNPRNNDEVVVAKPDAVAILPGSALYAGVLAQEQADILMPVDESKAPVLHDRMTVEQALAILKSAGARIEDIRRLTEKDAKAEIHELVDAYCILVGEGGMPVLVTVNAANKTLGAARKELKAQLAELEKFSDELKKGALAPALQTCLAANQLRIRRHTPRSSNETGALAAAREVAMFVAHPGSVTATIPLRAKWGHAVAGRIQSELLDDIKAGRVVEADGHLAAFRIVAESHVRMLEGLDPKDALRITAETRQTLMWNHSRFRTAPAADATRPNLAVAKKFVEELVYRVNKVEEDARLGKGPRQPDKKDPPKDPKTDEPPPKDPPPKPPPFGEENPPSPPPPPPPPFGEQP